MKPLAFVPILFITFSALKAQRNYTDSFFRDNKWWFTVDSKTASVKNFYPDTDYCQVCGRLAKECLAEQDRRKQGIHITAGDMSQLWPVTILVDTASALRTDTASFIIPVKHYQR